MRKITQLKVLPDYRLWLQFDDGLTGQIDFSTKPRTGVYAPWRDYDFFRKAHIDSDGQLVWDDQLDFSADSLWLEIKKKAELSSAHA